MNTTNQQKLIYLNTLSPHHRFSYSCRYLYCKISRLKISFFPGKNTGKLRNVRGGIKLIFILIQLSEKQGAGRVKISFRIN